MEVGVHAAVEAGVVEVWACVRAAARTSGCAGAGSGCVSTTTPRRHTASSRMVPASSFVGAAVFLYIFWFQVPTSTNNNRNRPRVRK